MTLMRWLTAFLFSAIILTVMSVGVVAEYGRIRKAQEKAQYDDALTIVLIQYKAIVEHIESGDEGRHPLNWPEVEAVTDKLKIEFQEKWGETFREYLDRGGDSDYEFGHLEKAIEEQHVLPVDE